MSSLSDFTQGKSIVRNVNHQT